MKSRTYPTAFVRYLTGELHKSAGYDAARTEVVRIVATTDGTITVTPEGSKGRRRCGYARVSHPCEATDAATMVAR